MAKLILTRIPLLIALLVLAALTIAEAAPPIINVWYGLNQAFGQRGNPQAAINILGNVSPTNEIASLSYTLNGQPSVGLSRGPDTRRLLLPGDFNIDINTSSLTNGSNTIVITATNSSNETSTATVNVQYTAGQTWPTFYVIDWALAGSIQNVAQVVDGKWAISNGALIPVEIGYDRLVAIGDRTWSDYEVTVPITIHRLDTNGFNEISQTPGVGLLFRWTGHTDNPIANWQPKTGYLPLGAIGWYSWDYGNTGGVRLKLVGNNLNTLQEDFSGFSLTFGNTYIFKMRVETIQNQGSEYKFKVWQVGLPEPGTWTLQGQQSLSDPQNGSICLLSHHVDAEFGNVTITPLGPVPIQLSSFAATLQRNNQVRLDWTTISETNNYGFEIQKSLEGNPSFQTIPNSFIPGHGTTLEPRRYSFVDSSTSPGHWYYRLKQIDLDGTINYVEPVQVNILTGIAEKNQLTVFALEQNYPNPFNPSTVIKYALPKDNRVRLEVFNPLGQKVATLIDEVKSAGSHTQAFDASALTSGVYFYKLTADGLSFSRKMVLIR